MAAAFTLYGDTKSGNCLKVRWTADLLGRAYDWVEVDLFKGETRTEDFLARNPAGQVPCVVFADGRALSQSNAILLHLAEGSRLLPADAFERALVNQWLFWEQYTHEPAIAVRRSQKLYHGKSEDEIDPKLMEKGLGALSQMERHLADRSYFVGAGLTAADIALVAYTRVAHEGGFDLSPFKHVAAWVARVERDLSIQPATEAV